MTFILVDRRTRFALCVRWWFNERVRLAEPKISIDERINQVVRWTLENESVKTMKFVKGWYLPDPDTHFEHYIKDGGYQTIHRDTILKYIKENRPNLKNCIDVGSHVGFGQKILLIYLHILLHLILYHK